MSSRYAPSLHPAPDNLCHTFLIAGVSAFLIWVAGGEISELILAKGPQGSLEMSLADGSGPPLWGWIESVSDEDPDFLWNRILGLAGFLLALGALARLVSKADGITAALPSVLILAVFPGLASWVTVSGFLGLTMWCFLRAFRSAQLGESKASWVRGGIWLGLAAGLHPVWILPALAFFGGLFEAKRRSLFPVAVTSVITFAVLYGVGRMSGGLTGEELSPLALSEGSWDLLLPRHVFLLGAFFLMLVFGATRRGPGWWCLMGSLILPVMVLVQGKLPQDAWIPLLMMIALGLAKLPTLLDIRHPRAYQSLLLCQLLLWLPVTIQDNLSELPFENREVQEAEHD